jgi:hypothetical protein
MWGLPVSFMVKRVGGLPMFAWLVLAVEAAIGSLIVLVLFLGGR